MGGQAFLKLQSEQPKPWEAPLTASNSSSADRARATATVQRQIERLKSLQTNLKSVPVASEESVGVGPQEELTTGLDELQEPVETAYPELDVVRENFAKVDRKWRVAATRSLNSDKGPATEIPEMPPFQITYYKATAGTKIGEQYRDLYSLVYELHNGLRKRINNAWESDTLHRFEDLVTLHRLRSTYLATMHDLGDKESFKLTPDLWSTIAFESKLIRHRYDTFITIKKSSIRESLAGGVVGWLELFRMLSRIALAVLFPLGVFLFLRWITRWLSERVEEKSQLGTGGRVFLQLLPWIGTLPALTFIAESLMRTLALLEVAIIPVLARYLILYRIGGILLRTLILYLTRGFPQSERFSVQKKTKRTVRLVAGSWVATSLFLEIVRFTIGRAFIYWKLSSVVYWVMLIVVLIVSLDWKPLLHYLGGSVLGKTGCEQLKKLMQNPIGWFASPFVLLFLGLATVCVELINFGRRFDWFNKLLATLSQQQTGARKSRGNVPQEYVSSFRQEWKLDNSSALGTAFESACLSIDRFLEDDGEGTPVVVTGPHGSGRGLLLEYLREQYAEKLETTLIKVSDRISNEQDAVRLLSKEIIQEEYDQLDQLMEALEKGPRRLLLVSKAHNLFLSQVDGFDALRTFKGLSFLHNLKVCFAFDPHTWGFLWGVIRSNLLIPNVLKIPRLSPQDLRQFVLERHKGTGYELSYDDGLLGGSFDPDDLPNLESAFFQQLWDCSQGVPGIAEKVWINCLESGEQKVLTVKSPERFDLKRLDSLSDEALFFFAALYRHETLTVKEAALVTDLGEALAGTVFRLASDAGLLEADDSGYRINPRYYTPLSYYLRRKNYLYGG